MDQLYCPIISVDDHALEPPTLFEDRVPAAMRDRAPRLEQGTDGKSYWHIDDQRIPIILNDGAISHPMSDWLDRGPADHTAFRPGVADSKARLADMDLTGVWASLCFGSGVWGFAGWRLAGVRDPAVGLASLRAYNDWMLEEWCGADRDRYIPCQLPWLRDPVIAAEEVRRNAARGFRAVSFTENPEALGYPHIYGSDWDPFFAACEETETVVNLHVGSNGQSNASSVSSAAPIDVLVALFPLSGMRALVDWVFAKVPIRFPGIKIAMSEAGVSWVPMILERLGRAHRQLDASTAWTREEPHPIDLVRRNFYFTSIEDPAGFRLLDLVGDGHVMVETDYPHQDSSWPGSQALIRAQIEHLPGETVRKLCFGNAAELYRHPPPPADMVARSFVGEGVRT